MLTADLAMSWQRGRRTGPRYIDVQNASYLNVAADLIAITERHRGCRRVKLDKALEEYVGVGTDYKILRGLIKLLQDRCVFETSSSIDPAEIRRVLFFKARTHHPVTTAASAREQVMGEAAGEL